jgi:hypothetical protein
MLKLPVRAQMLKYRRKTGWDGQELMLKLPVRAQMLKYRRKTGWDGQELMLKLPVRAHMRKYRREDRMRWTIADAEVACQGTDAKV